MTIVDLPTGPPTPAIGKGLPPLTAGDQLDQPTFHARYLAMPEGIRAELVEGIVYMPPPPVADGHSAPHAGLVFWLGYYQSFTAGVRPTNDGTTILGRHSQPQPDATLRIAVGGQARLSDAGYVVGCPELVCEVANSTEAYDLHAKRRDYERHGAQEYIAIVVRTPAVVWFARRGKRLVEVPPDPDGLYRSQTFPGLWLDPSALLANDARGLRLTLDAGLATPEHAAFVADLAGRQP